MKVYTYLYHENSDYACDADVEVFGELEDAQTFMRSCYESFLKNSNFDTTNMDDDHYAEINDYSATVVNGMDSYHWEIKEHEVKLPSATAEEIANEIDGERVLELAEHRLESWFAGRREDVYVKAAKSWLDEIVDCFYQKTDPAISDNQTMDAAILDVFHRHESEWGIKVVDSEDLKDVALDIIKDVTSGIHTDFLGQAVSEYKTLAYDPKTGHRVEVGVTFQTVDLDKKDRYFSVNVLDDINGKDGYILDCAPNKEGLTKALKQVVEHIGV